MRHARRFHVAALAAALAAGGAMAQTASDPGIALKLDRTTLELRLSAQRLTNEYGDWSEAGLVGTRQIGAHVVRAEVATMRRFREPGNYVSVMDTMTLSPDWYASVAAGAGDGAFYLPRYRVDAFIHRKVLADRRLVLSLGAGHYRAPDGHIDRSVTVGGHWYAPGPWILQAAVRFNESDPGSVRARQQILAATYLPDERSQVVARYAWGRESYLAIGPATSLVDFASREASLQWRHRIGAAWGVLVGVEHYRNPLYRRDGVQLGAYANLP